MSKKRKRFGGGFYIIAAALLLTLGVMARLSTGVLTPQKSESQETPSKAVSEAESQPSYEENKDSTPSESESHNNTTESTEQSSVAEEQPSESDEATAENVAAEKIVTFALPVTGDIIKSFDSQRLQYSKTYGDMRLHNGIDIIGEEGTPVKASADGTVKSVTEDPLWGTTVVIEHEGGIETHYCGLNDSSVEVGQEIKMSKIVGTIGKTPCECLDESHLHFAMKQGDKWLSPLTVMGLE